MPSRATKGGYSKAQRDLIRDTRVAMGLSLKDFADLVDVSSACISAIENGYNKTRHLGDILNALDLTIEDWRNAGKKKLVETENVPESLENEIVTKEDYRADILHIILDVQSLAVKWKTPTDNVLATINRIMEA